jgi:hypothetical protein
LRVDGSGPGFFHHTRPVLKAALAASALACVGSSAFAETGAPMIAIERVTRFDEVKIIALPQGSD